MRLEQAPPDEASPRSWSWPRVRRVFVGVGIVLLAIPLLWLFVINVALWSGVVESLVSTRGSQLTVRLRHGWAWCVWPTRVHVSDLHLELRGTRWQLALELAEAEADIELHGLLSRRFEAEGIEGRDLSLALSLAPAHEPTTAASARDRDGLAVPRGARTRAEERAEEEDPWQIVLDDVDTTVARLEIGGFRSELEGRLTGALDLEVGKRVGPASLTLEVEAAELLHRDEVVVDQASGRAELSLDPYDPLERTGWAMLRMLSGAVDLRARVANLDWIRALDRELPVELADGRGTLVAEATLREGMLTAGSQLEYEADHVRITRPGKAVLDAGIVLETKAQPDGEGHAVLTEAELLGAQLGSAGAESSLMTADRILVTVGRSSADLAQSLGSMSRASVRVPSFTIADLGQVGEVGERLDLHDGIVAGRASVQAKDGDLDVLVLDLAVDIDELALALGASTELRADGYVRSEGTYRRAEDRLVLEPLHAKLRDVMLETSRGRTVQDWLEVHSATVRYDEDAQRLVADARGRIADLRSVLVHLYPGEELLDRAPELRVGTTPVEYALQLRHVPAGILIDVDEAEAPPIDVAATIARVDESTRAAVYLRWVNVGLVVVEDDVHEMELGVDPAWFQRKEAWVRDALGEGSSP